MSANRMPAQGFHGMADTTNGHAPFLAFQDRARPNMSAPIMPHPGAWWEVLRFEAMASTSWPFCGHP